MVVDLHSCRVMPHMICSTGSINPLKIECFAVIELINQLKMLLMSSKEVLANTS
jgi:hypothetical protein